MKDRPTYPTTPRPKLEPFRRRRGLTSLAVRIIGGEQIIGPALLLYRKPSSNGKTTL